MRTILFVLGTRPEAIKLAPLILFFRDKEIFNVIVCNTGQHLELTNEVLEFFQITADYNLKVMTHNQTLAKLQAKIMLGIDELLQRVEPEFVIVQGDTTTAFSAGITSFYRRIKIVHVEAGLRSNDKFSPFPEEINRLFLSKISYIHFTPTSEASQNLANEGIVENVWNVGNTVIDALHIGMDLIEKSNLRESEYFHFLDNAKRTILLTTHRRENFGRPLLDICLVVKTALQKYKNIQFVCPVHPNPNVKDVLFREIGDLDDVFLIDPLNYPNLISLMNKSYLIISDSGGIQEEAPSLGKPVIVLRDTTERMEGVNAGTAVLGGNTFSSIWTSFVEIMNNEELYRKMSKTSNPYGDGNSCDRIYNIISNDIE